MSHVVEIARFRVEPEAEKGLLASWPAMVTAMKGAHPTLETVRLVRFEDGTWADIAVWTDQNDAESACAIAPLPEVEAFFANIAEDVSMDLAAVVLES
jgi:hypothetical protein